MPQNKYCYYNMFLPSGILAVLTFLFVATKTNAAVFEVVNQDFVKLDQYDRTNFIHWQYTMTFILTTPKISCALDRNLQPCDEDTTTSKLIEKYEKRMSLLAKVYFESTFLSTRCSVHFREVHKIEKQRADKFMIMKYFEFLWLIIFGPSPWITSFSDSTPRFWN